MSSSFVSFNVISDVLHHGGESPVARASPPTAPTGATASHPPTDHELLDALRGIAYMTGSAVQRHQYDYDDKSGGTGYQPPYGSSSRGAPPAGPTRSGNDGVTALVDLLAAGVDAQRLVAIIERR